jgi:hypothetical protein
MVSHEAMEREMKDRGERSRGRFSRLAPAIVF